MRCQAALLFAFAIIVVSTGRHRAEGAPVAAGSIRGISGCGTDAASLKALTEANVSHVRRYMMWRDCQPVIHHVNASLTVDDLRRDADALIYSWSAGLTCWPYFDGLVSDLVSRGIMPVLEATEGTKWGLPTRGDTGELLSPDNAGHQAYLAYQYRWVRAVVHRYKNVSTRVHDHHQPERQPRSRRNPLHEAPSTTPSQRSAAPPVLIVQIENELNEAFLEFIYGQRPFALAWTNWTFLTELLSTLHLAVRDECPDVNVCATTMNFHTDVPREIHELLHLPGYYLNAIADWHPFVDVVAIDAYPNMYVAWPSRGHVVAQRVAKVHAALLVAAKAGAAGPPRSNTTTKPIMVMETGYPVLADGQSAFPNGTTLPSELLFSEAMQSAYVHDVYSSLHALPDSMNVAGMLYFDLGPSKGMTAPPGGYSRMDEAMMTELAAFLRTQNITQLLDWLFVSPDALSRLVEVVTRAPMFLTRADDEGGWGLLDEDGSPRQGYLALQQAYRG